MGNPCSHEKNSARPGFGQHEPTDVPIAFSGVAVISADRGDMIVRKLVDDAGRQFRVAAGIGDILLNQGFHCPGEYNVLKTLFLAVGGKQKRVPAGTP